MNVGDQHSFAIYARSFWNDSGIDLVDAATYEFSAQGSWTDLFIPCGPGGYSGFLYQKKLDSLLRLPGVNWLSLCGALDQDGQTAFLIGQAFRYSTERPGRLYCFANDVPGWYWNNFGCVKVMVKRVD
jgi:hypothetical protein